MAWLVDNNLPAPCTVTQIIANMSEGPGNIPVAEALETVSIPMDLPLSHLTPSNTPVQPTQTSISLAPSTAYAAYPPLTIVVKAANGQIGFVELEELPGRGTVGLRGLATFSNSNLVFELGGGGEIQDGWGLDIIAQGIWRAPQLPVEISHPGTRCFPIPEPSSRLS